MDFVCPSCQSDNIQRLSVIFEGGLSDINTKTKGTALGIGRGGIGVGVGASKTTGTSQTAASKRAAPPAKKENSRSAAGFPNALLLDAGPSPVPLHVVSAFMDTKERLSKERAIAEIGAQGAWVWRTEEKMPPFRRDVELAPPS